MSQTALNNPAQFSDRELYEKCKEYGSNARMWAKKFVALLPEVERRQLYKKHGFYSIFEFSAKLAGMGRETVLEVLRVAKKLEDKPMLLATMETHGWGKLKVIANMATKETEAIWVEKVKEMSLSTLATFVKEIRKQNDEPVQNRIDSATTRERSERAIVPESEQLAAGGLAEKNSFHVLEPSGTPYRITVRMPLKPKTELRLRQLQKKLSQKAGAPIDFNQIMETLLDSYEANSNKQQNNKRKQNKIASPSQGGLKVTAEEKPVLLQQKKMLKQTIAGENDNLETRARQKFQELEERAPYESKSKRQIPIIIKKFILSKSAGRCAYPDCQKLPQIFHHTKRFALAPDHNPDFLAPLCKEHEHLAHHGLIENESGPPNEWRVQMETDKNSQKFEVDRKVNTKRMNTNVIIQPDIDKEQKKVDWGSTTVADRENFIEGRTALRCERTNSSRQLASLAVAQQKITPEKCIAFSSGDFFRPPCEDQPGKPGKYDLKQPSPVLTTAEQ